MFDQRERFVLSRWLQRFPLSGGATLVAHGPGQRRTVMDAKLLGLLEAFAEPRSADELGVLTGDAQAATNAARFFAFNLYIVPHGADEDMLLREHLMQFARSKAGRLTFKYERPVTVSVEALASAAHAETPRELSVLLLGGCFTQFTADSVEACAPRFGFHARTAVGWPQDLHLVDQHQPDVVVLQPSIVEGLSPLYDAMPFLTPAARQERFDALCAYFTSLVEPLVAKAKGRLVLVQGLSSPQASPHGRFDFRLAQGFRRMVEQLNEHLRALARGHANVMFVDEERVLSNAGKRLLMDDLVSPYSHHGPLDYDVGYAPEGPTLDVSFGIQERMGVLKHLSEEYLSCFTAWSGHARLEAVGVRLEGTLWPTLEGGFPPEDRSNEFKLLQTFRFGVFGGIHQALKILKKRGVRLFLVTRLSKEETLTRWSALSARLGAMPLPSSCLLLPEDFDAMAHGGDPAESFERLLASAGLRPKDALYVDREQEPREAVARRHRSRVTGEDLNFVRGELLTSPWLEREPGETAASPVTMAVPGISDAQRSFLKSQAIQLEVKRVDAGSNLQRLAELFSVSNQFNTSQRSYDVATLRAMVDDPTCHLFTLSASDKFTRYGLSGVCLLRERTVEGLVITCASLKLRPGVPFLLACLKAAGLTQGELRGLMEYVPRNEPCRQVFAEAGFVRGPDGSWTLPAGQPVPELDAGMYQLRVV